MSPIYLSTEAVVHLHKESIDRLGGVDGILNRSYLESAVAQPMASFGGVEANPSLLDKAAAYAFHIINAHAFRDGNKRAGMLAAIVFLDMNGFLLDLTADEIESVGNRVAGNQLSKSQLSDFLAGRLEPKSDQETT